MRNLTILGLSIGPTEKITISVSVGVAVIAVIALVVILITKRMKLRAMDNAKRTLALENEELKSQFENLTSEQTSLLNEYDQVKNSEERYRKLALEDLLTGLPNRTALTELLDMTLTTMNQDEQSFLMYIDIQNLKEVNDSIGYTYGDELLIDASHRLKQSLDENDFLARINGDEFVILTRNVENSDVYEDKIKKIQTIFSYPFTLASKEYFISLSIGICQFGKDGRTSQGLLKNANAAMHEAREIGKNQYYYYDEVIQSKLAEQIQKQSEVRTAFEQNEFTLVYQPILSLKEHKVIGLEALLRWDHQIEGRLLPIDFLPALVESGVIVPLGGQMLVKACHTFMNWKQSGYPELTLTINLSLRQLLEEDFVRFVEVAITETGMLPKDLVFDIEEKTLESEDPIVATRIQQLQELGVKIALDHYGAGTCSLRLLKEATFSYIKIDSALFYDIAVQNREKTFINNLVDVIDGLGSKVVFEGVEEATQLEALEQCQCDYVQGFLFSKPLEEEEVITYLQTWM